MILICSQRYLNIFILIFFLCATQEDEEAKIRHIVKAKLSSPAPETLYFCLASWHLFTLLFNCSVMADSLWPHELQHARLPFPSWSPGLFKFMPTELVMPSNHLIFCHLCLILSSIFPRIRLFSNESVLCIRWPKYWSFSVSLSGEYSGVISFRIDWFDLPGI